MAIARKMFLSLAALFLLFASAQQTEAQFLGEVVCWWCIETEDGQHGFTMNVRGCGSEGEYPDHPIPAQCVRCGKTSECHEENWPGPCHIACGPAGDAVMAQAELQGALESEDISIVAATLLKERSGVIAEFIPDGGRIDLLLSCDPNKPFRTIPVVPTLREALVAALDLHSLQGHPGTLAAS